MRTDEMKLDGNALGGMMLELFGREMTAASSTCGSCGAVEQMAWSTSTCRRRASSSAAGIARASLKVVRSPERTWLDLSGIRLIELLGAFQLRKAWRKASSAAGESSSGVASPSA